MRVGVKDEGDVDDDVVEEVDVDDDVDDMAAS